MVYIIGLLVLLAAIFSFASNSNLAGDLWSQATKKFNNFAFPKSEKEIVIDNLKSQYSELDRFFSSVAPSLLNSDAVTPQDKETLKRAVRSFGESQNSVNQIQKLEKEGKSITKAVIEKILNLDTEPEPTSIPPQCRLECAE